MGGRVTATARIEGGHSYGAASASTAVIPTTLIPLHTTKCCLTASVLNSLVFPADTLLFSQSSDFPTPVFVTGRVGEYT